MGLSTNGDEAALINTSMHRGVGSSGSALWLFYSLWTSLQAVETVPSGAHDTQLNRLCEMLFARPILLTPNFSWVLASRADLVRVPINTQLQLGVGVGGPRAPARPHPTEVGC